MRDTSIASNVTYTKDHSIQIQIGAIPIERRKCCKTETCWVFEQRQPSPILGDQVQNPNISGAHVRWVESITFIFLGRENPTPVQISLTLSQCLHALIKRDFRLFSKDDILVRLYYHCK